MSAYLTVNGRIWGGARASVNDPLEPFAEAKQQLSVFFVKEFYSSSFSKGPLIAGFLMGCQESLHRLLFPLTNQ